ncbi:hypothetical protein BGS_0348 [Beggiatoa sp. SS]|nr:hypothetical protein BGS_0348 [Beggiatoa sp. SS]
MQNSGFANAFLFNQNPYWLQIPSKIHLNIFKIFYDKAFLS